MIKTLVFAGCSFTAGTGWNKKNLLSDGKDDIRLWTNLCFKNIKRFCNHEILNVGQCNASNAEIFQNTVRAIASNDSNIDTIFCQWTSVPRYSFNVGFELWNTSESLNPGSRLHNVNLNRGNKWTRSYVNDLIDRLRVLHHLHWEIVKIVDYSNILSNLAKQKKINIFFINGLCPWDHNYFVELHNVKPEKYTPFTKKDILNIETRNDNDIYKLYHLAHQHYQNAGGVDQSQWINLYNSFQEQIIDRNFDNGHPGKKSNQLFFEQIKSKLTSLSYI